ncbi:hypothetical protein O6H91_05G053300 [Diphasiastrum complanatum]|uniref:Uncharacterized protein n=1 Tax=Diphasiastrum complanatum TaxID=34168 RepID=A0ACC2DNC9_DIPCM|nr:hypothetical protein O6H91_05G053300 [Diphasiastrum complanatum]
MATVELGSEADAHSSTFCLADEDHTLGNSVRFVLNRDPRVAFCGYSVPHPSDNRVNVRVQTTGAPAKDVFKDALQDLIVISEHVRTTFERALDHYKATEGVREISMKSGVTHESLTKS